MIAEAAITIQKHECNEERSRATSFDRYISLRILWDEKQEGIQPIAHQAYKAS